ncbi:hypothetical protein [Actinoplanes regularis]|uniref:Uncharacterized protein n=1 Tax=Actinoplanes regularis TaxID=52697 RepID=A0A238XKK3_9ACTN|nr:hypothetical protein [Actinoplanes regularis]GIE90517.1 hypothetical protein Are01nite_69970 [Actinoplanes regularis]SNR59003.1 hypothetical protein SAMN06264365_103509 [Actinoplanes regularis]
MSEQEVTAAIYSTFDHPELIIPVTAALTQRADVSPGWLLRSEELWTWMCPPRRRGPDLAICGSGLRLGATVEVKLAGGRAQWSLASFADAAAVRDDPAARRFAARLADAVIDPQQMPHGTKAHDLRDCGCTWADGYHGKAHHGGWACGIPQLDYYCYFNNWLPAWMHDSALSAVAWVFLSAGPADLVGRYPGLDSADRWRVLTFADFLNELLGDPAVKRPPAAAAAAVDRLCRAMWDEIPSTEANQLSQAARRRVATAVG